MSSEVKAREWFATKVIGSENKLHCMSTDEEFIDKIFFEEKFEVIEKSAAVDRDIALRCMQQILKANGSMTYKEFLINLEACGLKESELGEL